MANRRGLGTALRVLADAPIEVVMDLLDVVFVAAVTTHPQVGLGRTVLSRLDPGWLASALRPLAISRLDRHDISAEEYRRLAELLSFLDQSALLYEVVRRASASTDLDSREVADDFRRPRQ